jgi:pilus assembly protein CpaF
MLSSPETMVVMGMEIPLSAVRGQIASGIDIIVHLGRLRDRSRKLLEICELEKELDPLTGKICVNQLFRFEEKHVDKEGRIVGSWRKTGELKNTEKLVAAGFKLPSQYQ